MENQTVPSCPPNRLASRSFLMGMWRDSIIFKRTSVQWHSFPRRARDRRRHFGARLGPAVLQSFCLLEAPGILFLAALSKQQYSLNFQKLNSVCEVENRRAISSL